MIRWNWINLRLVLMIMVMFFLFVFTSFRNKERIIKELDVIFNENDMPFLNEEMVNNLLIQNLNGTSAIQKEKVDLKKLEQVLSRNSYIYNTQVFCSVDGVVKAKIFYKKPVVRVIEKEENFYLDEFGSKIPWSVNFTPRIPVFFGKMNGVKENEMVKIFKIINEDEMLRQNITAATITEKGNLVFSVRGYDYKILFGKTSNTEQKFKNYKAFLQFATNDTLIKNYKTVNLVFSNQVVCTTK